MLIFMVGIRVYKNPQADEMIHVPEHGAWKEGEREGTDVNLQNLPDFKE